MQHAEALVPSSEHYAEAFVPRTDHIPVLDGLRGIAVLLVIWSHCAPVTSHTPLRYLEHVLQPGYFGVDIFFVLSGFLITRILLSSKVRRRPLRYFLMRRFLRIFPIYYLTLGAVALVQPRRYMVFCLFYLQNFYFSLTRKHGLQPLWHTWSLAVEEHFYLIWPLIVRTLSIDGSRRVALFGLVPMAVLSAVAAVALQDHFFNVSAFVYMGTMFRALSLVAGALFAFYEGWLREIPARGARLGLCLVIPGALLLAAGEFVITQWGPVTKMVGFSLVSAATVSTAIGLPAGAAWIGRGLRSAALTFVGRISYGLYLYHVPLFVLLGVERHGHPSVLIMLTAIVVSFAVATLSFYALEQPILRLKSRFQ